MNKHKLKDSYEPHNAILKLILTVKMFFELNDF